MKNIFQATKTRSNRPGWSIIFRHPKRTDSRGQAGLKIRKGLKTQDDNEADRLVGELNELLSDQSWWSADRRKEAELKYSTVIVSAFFDGLEAGKVSSSSLRDLKIALPTSAEGYSRILFAGTTGAGKTTLLRHVIGANQEVDRFPSTSTARTTTAEIEIVTAEGGFEAVVTFMPEHEVRAHIDECLEEACLCSIQGKPDLKILASFLAHREQRFRLSYLLGQSGEEDSGNGDDFEFDDIRVNDGIDPGEVVPSDEVIRNQSKLREYLESVRSVSLEVGKRIEEQFGSLTDQKNPDDRATWLELFGDALYEEEAFGKLALDIMDDVEDRFDFVKEGCFDKGPTGWPSAWFYSSDSRSDFLRQVRWFSSNHHKQFGRLLTPLVDGVRVRGPLFPAIEDLRVADKLVLLDGEGIGHTAKSASSISTRVTRKFPEVDMILIVDNAEQPMQGAPLELLRTIGNSGHADKIAVAFTHFDQVKGANLGSFANKRDHVMNSVRDAVNSLRQSVGASVAGMLEDQIEKRAFFLGGMDREIDEIPSGFQKQIIGLLELMQAAGEPSAPIECAPIYSVEGLEIALRDAVEGFQGPWKARLGKQHYEGFSKEHWTRVKALTRRLANAWANEYDDMRPVADLVSTLQESISKWLDSPADWTREPRSADERNAALSVVRMAVFTSVHELAETRLADSHRIDWTAAFDFAGNGSSYRRADLIERIYEEAAPVIHSAMSAPARDFLHRLHQIVRQAVENTGGQFLISQIGNRG
jgi:energy-coupling factor transporter ATP-binding protein EcfA2